MMHCEFRIGCEFYTSTGKWLCTDVGNRVVIAISLETRKLVRMQRNESGEVIRESIASNDPQDLVGPPYMVAEHVFDEYSLKGCYATAAEDPL